MITKKHVSTYPLFGHHPLSIRVDTNNRVGTGYIYSFDQIAKEEARLAKYGHPMRLRWRNDECYADYCAWISERSAA